MGSLDFDLFKKQCNTVSAQTRVGQEQAERCRKQESQHRRRADTKARLTDSAHAGTQRGEDEVLLFEGT